MKIEVIYDGDYPNTCSGLLTIIVDSYKLYERRYRCTSTGGIDENYNVFNGELIWEDSKLFSKKIRKAVEYELSKHEACCGGCI